MEEIITYFRFQEIHICFIIRVYGCNIAPVIFDLISIDTFQIFVTNQDVFYKIVAVFQCTPLDQLDQLSSSNYIDTGRNAVGIAYHRFLFEFFDPAVFIHFDNTESCCVFSSWKVFTYHGDICFFLDMIFQHFVVIQLVYTITGSNDHIRLMTFFQEIQVLCDRICRTAVPETVVCCCGRCKYKQTALFTSEIPPFGRTQMLV